MYLLVAHPRIEAGTVRHTARSICGQRSALDAHLVLLHLRHLLHKVHALRLSLSVSATSLALGEVERALSKLLRELALSAEGGLPLRAVVNSPLRLV